MSDFTLTQTQKTTQVQSQIMSMKQIQAMRLIGMGSQELRDEILGQAAENPALEIIKDSFSAGVENVRRTGTKNSVRTGSAGRTGQEESDSFQQMLESSPDERKTLREHLLHQLNMMKLPAEKYSLCKKIINNLNPDGYYILAPESLTDGGTESTDLLSECISIVRQFEPAGICCQNVTESLFIQAKLRHDASVLTLFILDSHLDFINPPNAEKTYRKVLNYIQEQTSLAFQTEKLQISQDDVTVKNAEDSIKYIQSLNPFPARNFGQEASAHFISPDVYVVRTEGNLEKENTDTGFVIDSDRSYFRIYSASDIIPSVRIAQDFRPEKFEKDEINTDEMKFIEKQQKEAQNFMDALDFRQKVIIRSCSNIVMIQKDFFRKGPGNLAPLTQKQLAEKLGIHESSVSRMADSKFINCEWGTFPVRYFFSNAVGNTEDEDGAVSADTIRHEIQQLMDAAKQESKRISDQKIADILTEKGFKVARRTVAKYRAQLNIGSSYDRR